MSLTAIQTQGPIAQGSQTSSTSNVEFFTPYMGLTQMAPSTLMSSNISKLAPALLKAQLNTSAASKDAKNPYFNSNYADLNAVLGAVQPALNAEGIILLQPTVQANGKNYVRTLLIHAASGEFIGSDTEIVTKATPTAQENGSAMSYSRRYGLQSLLSVRTTDDDGASASGKTSTPSREPAESKPRSSFSKTKPVTQPAATTEQVAPKAPEEDSWE